jgi:hypothetical protein
MMVISDQRTLVAGHHFLAGPDVAGLKNGKSQVVGLQESDREEFLSSAHWRFNPGVTSLKFWKPTGLTM